MQNRTDASRHASQHAASSLLNTFAPAGRDLI